MKAPTRSWTRTILLPIALSVLGFGFISVGTVLPNEPLAAVHPKHDGDSTGIVDQGRSDRGLEKDKRVFFVLLIIADQLQAGRR
jgi:hypothetical protein